MVSKNNWQVKERNDGNSMPRYGLRKLAVGGVASVLLGIFYLGINSTVVQADQNNTVSVDQDPVTAISSTKSKDLNVRVSTKSQSDSSSIENSNSVNNSNPSAKITDQSNKNAAQMATPATAKDDDQLNNENENSTDVQKKAEIESKKNSESFIKTVPTKNTANVNNQQTIKEQLLASQLIQKNSNNSQNSINKDNVSASIDRTEYNPRDGQAIQITVKVVSKVGDEITIQIPRGAYSLSPTKLTGSAGTTGIKTQDDGSTIITDTFTSAGTYNQSIKLVPYNSEFDLNGLKPFNAGSTQLVISIAKNQQKEGLLSFVQTITPAMKPTFTRTQPDAKSVGKLTTGVDYQWQLVFKEDPGTAMTAVQDYGPSYSINHGTTVTIPAPAGFVLNATASEENSKNNFSGDKWSIEQPDGIGTNVICTNQEGTASAGAITLVGHFTQPLTEKEQHLAANGKIHIIQDTGNGTQLKAEIGPFAETLIGKDDTHPTGDVFEGDVYPAYGTGEKYPSGDVPLAKNKEPISFWKYLVGNNSAFNIDNVDVKITLPDGMKATKLVLPSQYNSGDIHYSLHLYVDSKNPDKIVSGVVAGSGNNKVDFTKYDGNVRSIDLKLANLGAGVAYTAWNYSSSDGFRVYGYVNDQYDNGKLVKIGDKLTSTLTIGSPLTGYSGQGWHADQYVVAKNVQPVNISGLGIQTTKAPGAIGAGILQTVYELVSQNEDFTDPTFYYVLPQNSVFQNINLANKKGASITHFKASDGRTVIKVTYHGVTGKDFTEMSQDMISLNNIADLPNSTSQYKIFLVIPNGISVVKEIKVNEETEREELPHATSNELKYVENNKAAYLIGSGMWIVQSATGAQIAEQSQGNKNAGLGLKGESDNKGLRNMTFTGSIVNNTKTDMHNAVYTLNLPDTNDGKSGFNFYLNAPVTVIDTATGKPVSGATVEYSTQRVSLNKTGLPTGGNFVSEDSTQLKAVRAVRIKLAQVAAGQAVRVILNGIDPTLTVDIDKIGYLSSNLSTADSALKPITIMPTDPAASSVTVTGEHLAKVQAFLRFLDDTEKKIIDPINNKKAQLTSEGDVGTPIKFTGADDLVQYLLKHHYVFVNVSGSGSNNAKEYDKVSYGSYNATDVPVVFFLHFAHGSKLLTKKTVNETIHYVYAKGMPRTGKVAADYSTSVNFSRQGETDLVTGKTTWIDPNWTPDKSTFKKVQSPVIAGYTPDQVTVKEINVTPEDKDVELTVTYSADLQHANLIFHDDTTKQDLPTINSQKAELTSQGQSETAIKFANADDLVDYLLNHGYIFKGVTGEGSTSAKTYDKVTYGSYDTDPNTTQKFVLHFIHASRPATDQQTTVKETIHYIYAPGMPRSGKAADDYSTSVSFKRTGTTDLVTNTTSWNTWQPQSGSFSAVKSPVIQGYTPDQSSIDTITVKPGDKNIDRTVNYFAQVQNANLLFHDDTTNQDLPTINSQKAELTSQGQPETAIKFANADDLVNYLLNHGYIFKGVTGKGATSAKTYDKVTYGSYDTDPNTTQKFVLHFIHGTQNVNDQQTIKETVHYVYASGMPRSGQVAPDHQSEITFKRTGTQDLVTKAITWKPWQPTTGTFTKVGSPAIQGYTPDQSSIDTITVNPGDKNIDRTVNYSAQVQNAQLTFYDDTLKETLDTINKQPAHLTSQGGSETPITFARANDLVNYLLSHGYLFEGVEGTGSNGAKTYDKVTYGKYDTDPKVTQKFVLHFIHGTQNVSDQQTVKETVHYVYASGMSRSGQAAPDHQSEITFKRTGTQDLVTNQITWNAWQPESYVFTKVGSPTISGYTPDKAMINATTVKAGNKDIVETVTYTADQQKARLQFVDDTTGKIINTDANGNYYGDSTIGKTDEPISFSNSHQQLNKLLAEGYIFVSADDETNQQYPRLISRQSIGDPYDHIKFGNFDTIDGNTQLFTIHLKHQISDVNSTNPHGIVVEKTVERIIHYVTTSGQEVHSPVVQTARFTASGHWDQVLKQLVDLDGKGKVILGQNGSPIQGHFTWIAEGNTTDQQSFAKVYSPEINGYFVKNVSDTTPGAIDPNDQTDGTDVKLMPAFDHTQNNIDVTVYYQAQPGAKKSHPREQPRKHPEERTNISTGVPSTGETIQYNENSPKATRGSLSSYNHNIQIPAQETGNNDNRALPQTGNQDSKLGLVGLALTGLAGVLGLFKKRQDD